LQATDEANYAYELPLSLLRDRVAGLLATYPDKNRSIELRICSHPSTIAKETRLRVCDHAGSAEFPKSYHPDVKSVNVPESVDQQPWCDLKNAQIEVTEFGRSERAAPEGAITSVGPGQWDLELSHLEKGTWLATVWVSPGVCLEPFAVPGGKSLPAGAEETETHGLNFEQAINVNNPEARKGAWCQVVQKLASEPNHPDWERMDDLLRQSTRVPVTTFDAVSALISNPIAVALAGIRHVRSQELWERLQELPFLWATIGIGHWHQAWQLYWGPQREALMSLVDIDPAIQEECQREIDRKQTEFMILSQSHVPGMACTNACLIASQLAPRDDDAEKSLYPGKVKKITQEVQTLRTRLVGGHDKDDWPTLHMNIPKDVEVYLDKLGLQECADYQRAVLWSPVLAAWHSAFDREVPMNLMRQFHQLRGFDLDWFDRVHEQSMFLMAGERLRNDHRCYCP